VEKWKTVLGSSLWSRWRARRRLFLPETAATDGWKFRTPAELRRAIADEPVIYREGIVKEKMCYNKGKSLS
jgi:hypothetical protein